MKTVIGGFHFINSAPNFLAKIIDFFRSKGIVEIYPYHCANPNAKIARACRELKVQKVGTGTTINF